MNLFTRGDGRRFVVRVDEVDCVCRIGSGDCCVSNDAKERRHRLDEICCDGILKRDAVPVVKAVRCYCDACKCDTSLLALRSPLEVV